MGTRKPKKCVAERRIRGILVVHFALKLAIFLNIFENFPFAGNFLGQTFSVNNKILEPFSQFKEKYHSEVSKYQFVHKMEVMTQQ